MPDYRLFQKNQTVRAVNHVSQDQQDRLAAEGYKVVWDVVNADSADAALLRYQQLRHDEGNAAQNFATDSLFSSLLGLISR
ncbi:hypothetical protein F3I27_08880 [Pantoea sp. Bo_2]|uniref:hypothetical protein n=1 Tax=unclassified Pantoea TaxID=2630326 RepID=UPI001232CE1E|nr:MULTISPECIES: hypothetical protein [unclassified Pantoea]KAA5948333.1 hypothetical protein F3I57_06640 [Pantoea sp. VH_3]KAA5953603.1 hypothetical protein F3I56_08510 [Pantoea sp. VH_25]KAA5956562.1 hypothetical protein F3I55_10640 [Pantoea sp. VH_24]KAA5960407.1 hypothetical protein F3I53_10805 [Pantoea sp. VH_16]KAA5964979.1 hypothetical protein F3I54_11375 [Pantoea sp. VH_18]